MKGVRYKHRHRLFRPPVIVRVDWDSMPRIHYIERRDEPGVVTESVLNPDLQLVRFGKGETALEQYIPNHAITTDAKAVREFTTVSYYPIEITAGVMNLLLQGHNPREAAALLGVSHQRIYKLLTTIGPEYGRAYDIVVMAQARHLATCSNCGCSTPQPQDRCWRCDPREMGREPKFTKRLKAHGKIQVDKKRKQEPIFEPT